MAPLRRLTLKGQSERGDSEVCAPERPAADAERRIDLFKCLFRTIFIENQFVNHPLYNVYLFKLEFNINS